MSAPSLPELLVSHWQLDPSVADAMGPGDCKSLHARDFLQPVHDIRVIVDDQSMCHLFLGNLVFIGTANVGSDFFITKSRGRLVGGPSRGRLLGSAQAGRGAAASVGTIDA